MEIHGLNKTTLLDYPGHVAATLFTGGCNFRCPFCHNKDLVLSPSSQPIISLDEVFSFLEKRKNILTGVCITGGEPTLQKDLPEFIRDIKALGYLVKLDTNGYRPDILKSLVSDHLLDYVAMDIKTSPANYSIVTGLSSMDVSKIMESVSFLMSGSVTYEFRTTVVKELHKSSDFEEISTWLTGCRSYYLQSFKDSENVISPGFTCYDKEDLLGFIKMISNKIPHVFLRGVD
ncbi:MAG TPA: anaerobic ribonucleoside-triphosphate reductase activating protein [Lachnospiraceae bacterium]|nr:anaerobic ribonucleoside-triphosphate reductase activating protein [Lachnospiraceae bacterium]